MNTENQALNRRTDLDALRAGAMLLGIVLHASLSFFPAFWIVSDRQQAPFLGVMFSAIHGFRMPLFFIMSGFFSAMLLHRRGRGTLVKHRFKRVFLPLWAGMFTIVPLIIGISTLAMATAAPKQTGTTQAKEKTIWSAARAGDLGTIEQHLASGETVDSVDPEHGGTPLHWAAVTGQAEAIEFLINKGADVNFAGKDGGTALIAAAFLGHERAVSALVSRRANVNAANRDGSTALDVATLDDGTTRYFASILQLELDENGLSTRKAAIAELLRQHGATAGRKTGVLELLMQIPVFNHLWFLWFLWWLVLGYAGISAALSRLPSIRLPGWLVLSPARYLWLIPLTMIPQWFMGNGDVSPIFGPDTSTGLLPIPQVFAYYAIFFGIGVVLFNADDQFPRVGAYGWVPLLIAIFVLLPVGLALIAGWTGPAGYVIAPLPRRVLMVAISAAYPWLISFGLMGLLRTAFPVASPTMRYLSDSAYWLYLAHLPLVMATQLLVKDWPIPAVAKFLLIVVVTTLLLLWSYEMMVRYTWIGRFLNGPRARPEVKSTVAVAT